ncbi:MAG TPA: hypothetical protein PLI61_13400 [bacterium]|nr:hypothetical protein [bacterium]
MTIIIRPEEKSRLKELLAPVEWIWNPEKNTYGRVIFTILVTILIELMFFGTVAWIMSMLFMGSRIAVSIGGNGWHLVFIALKAIVLLTGLLYCGLLCVLIDLAAGYLMNLLYFQYAQRLKELTPS